MKNKLTKTICLFLSFCFFLQSTGFAQLAAELDISSHLAGLRNYFAQETFRPPHLRYLEYDNLNNTFNILLDKGAQKDLSNHKLSATSQELMRFFLIGVALPNDSFWVNLRPDSPDNIIDHELAKTDVGRILLEADLQLKKDTALATSPKTPEGKQYWDRLYKKAEELYGTQIATIPTLTRPWIVPDEIIIREADTNAYIYKATLKVMLEEDYLKSIASPFSGPDYSFQDSRARELNSFSTQLIRELILPQLSKKINTHKDYAALRQVYYSLILAQWFKDRYNGSMVDLQWSVEQNQNDSFINLINRKNLNNLTSNKPWTKETYFNAYRQSFEEGEYSLKEPVYTPTGQVIRSYVSGGIQFNAISASSAIVSSKHKGGFLTQNLLPGNTLPLSFQNDAFGPIEDIELPTTGSPSSPIITQGQDGVREKASSRPKRTEWRKWATSLFISILLHSLIGATAILYPFYFRNQTPSPIIQVVLQDMPQERLPSQPTLATRKHPILENHENKTSIRKKVVPAKQPTPPKEKKRKEGISLSEISKRPLFQSNKSFSVHKLPSMLKFTFSYQNEQSQAFGRASIYQEHVQLKGKVLNNKQLHDLLTQEKYLNDSDFGEQKSLYSAYNLSVSTFCETLTRAKQQNITLNAEEEEVKEYLLKGGFIKEEKDGYEVVKNMPLISSTGNEIEDRHELGHALYEIDPQYRQDIENIWNELVRRDPYLAALLKKWLTLMGYDNVVHLTEFAEHFENPELLLIKLKSLLEDAQVYGGNTIDKMKRQKSEEITGGLMKHYFADERHKYGGDYLLPSTKKTLAPIIKKLSQAKNGAMQRAGFVPLNEFNSHSLDQPIKIDQGIAPITMVQTLQLRTFSGAPQDLIRQIRQSDLLRKEKNAAIRELQRYTYEHGESTEDILRLSVKDDYAEVVFLRKQGAPALQESAEEALSTLQGLDKKNVNVILSTLEDIVRKRPWSSKESIRFNTTVNLGGEQFLLDISIGRESSHFGGEEKKEEWRVSIIAFNPTRDDYWYGNILASVRDDDLSVAFEKAKDEFSILANSKAIDMQPLSLTRTADLKEALSRFKHYLRTSKEKYRIEYMVPIIFEGKSADLHFIQDYPSSFGDYMDTRIGIERNGEVIERLGVRIKQPVKRDAPFLSEKKIEAFDKVCEQLLKKITRRGQKGASSPMTLPSYSSMEDVIERAPQEIMDLLRETKLNDPNDLNNVERLIEYLQGKYTAWELLENNYHNYAHNLITLLITLHLCKDIMAIDLEVKIIFVAALLHDYMVEINWQEDGKHRMQPTVQETIQDLTNLASLDRQLYGLLIDLFGEDNTAKALEAVFILIYRTDFNGNEQERIDETFNNALNEIPNEEPEYRRWVHDAALKLEVADQLGYYLMCDINMLTQKVIPGLKQEGVEASVEGTFKYYLKQGMKKHAAVMKDAKEELKEKYLDVLYAFIELSVVGLKGEEREQEIERRWQETRVELEEEFSFKLTPSPVTSQFKNLGGIDLRALPIEKERVKSLSGSRGLGRNDTGGINPEQEWNEIQRLVNGGIIPSCERIRGYLLGCCSNGSASSEIDRMLACIADIFRLEEEQLRPTEEPLRQILVLLESDKSAQELQLALQQIEITEKEPAIVNP